MNHQINEIFAFLFLTLPTLLLGIFIGVKIEYFSWSDTKNRDLDIEFKRQLRGQRYKKPIGVKKFAIENYISLKQSKQFLDNKLLEFGGIIVSKHGDTEYHFDILDDENAF